MENLTLEQLKIINDCLAASKYRYENDESYFQLNDYLNCIPIVIQAIADREFDQKSKPLNF